MDFIVKKASFLAYLFMLLVSSTGAPQTKVVDQRAKSRADIFEHDMTPNIFIDPCSYEQPRTTSTNAYNVSSSGPFQAADDFDVVIDDTFTLETFTVSILLTPGALVTSSRISFWENSAGLPGQELSGFPFQVPVTQTVVGEALGLDIVECVYDLSGFNITFDGGSDGTRYWISFGNCVADSGSSRLWEATDEIIGKESAYLVNGVWSPGVDTFSVSRDMVFILEGDCVLGVDDNLANLVNIYPNPATTTINIDFPANIEISKAVLYDVFGKNTGVTLVNALWMFPIFQTGCTF